MLTATKYLRKLPGGSQPHLLGASDGHAYIVKHPANNQHRRILINEIVATEFYRAFKLPVADTAIISVPEDIAAQVINVRGTQKVAWTPALCFASRCVASDYGNVMDRLPDSYLLKLDLRPFSFIRLVDFWLANVDSRQAVFFHHRGIMQYRFVDHGFIFDGENWELASNPHPLHGGYFNPLVYRDISDQDQVAAWLRKINAVRPKAIMRRALARIPAEWLEVGETEILLSLAASLARRRKKLPELLSRFTNALGIYPIAKGAAA